MYICIILCGTFIAAAVAVAIVIVVSIAFNFPRYFTENELSYLLEAACTRG